MRTRLALSLIALAVALLPLPLFGVPDFAQDYAAAWAWWHGTSPNGRTDLLLNTCCGDLAHAYPPMQTAHPPLATLLALPFALLPWPLARLLWTLVCCAALFAGWQLSKADRWLCLATLPYWALALILGTHEALIFALLATALLIEPQAPLRAGALVGLCAALKLYPGLLIVGLVLAGKRRAALSALAAGLAALLLCESVLGFGITLGWLAYLPVNTRNYIDQIDNLSLVRLLRLSWPTAPALPAALALAVLLTAPLLGRLRKGHWLAALVPVMLLASPLSWRHYIGLVALGSTGRVEQALLAACGTLTLLVGLGLLAAPSTAVIVQIPLLAVLLLMWYRQLRLARGATPEAAEV